jgi:hypothetical protein
MGRSDVGVQADTRPGQYLEFSAITIKKRSLALFFMRLPVFVPFVFIARGWFSLNQQDILVFRKPTCWGPEAYSVSISPSRLPR